ncbi:MULTISPECIES: hypothetical protein [unclassified Geodermatophilus]|uniref:LGFP repeat-containing protein n=1 Tax=unclassified Geodermatophilus TaxID=2637632 RepID=UPI003EEB073C
MSYRTGGRPLAALLLALVTGALCLVAVPAAAQPCTQADPIERHHCELGGTASFLGPPLGPQYPVGAGRGQDYAGGAIYWSPGTGAHEVHGWVRDRYLARGGPTAFLGFPVTDETPVGDGVGVFSHFQGGSVYSTPGTGAHEVHGWVRDRWNGSGGARGFLGYPVTDETPVGDGVGVFSHFQGGSVYSTPGTGAHEVHGWVRDRWNGSGGARGFLGYPVTDETPVGDGVGVFSHFQGGSVYSTPATGAHEIHGSIRGRYDSLGGPRSVLGYPITSEYDVVAGRQSDTQGGFLRWTAATGAVRVAVLDPYEHAGTWITRFRFSREYGGPNPVIRPEHVDAMADAGVHTIYLQAAAPDPRYPGLISPDLQAAFLTRAHARGMRVVAWYLPTFTDVDADLRRLMAMVDFRASGQAFDGIGVDIEDRTVTDVATRNARLVDLSTRLHAAAPGVTLSAIVLPPVVLDVINRNYWPSFPWRQLAPLYQVWQPMAYWSNRTDPVYSDAYRYTAENTTRLRGNLGEACAAVSTIGGFGATETAADYAGMARAAREQGAIGVSVFDWTTTPAGAWPELRGYDVRGC